MDHPIISADSHVNEPDDLWSTRLPAHMRHRAPHRELVDGVEHVVFEGMRPRKIAGGESGKAHAAIHDPAGAGGWDPERRIRDQEQDGVRGEVIFPGSFFVYNSPDPVLQIE